MSFSPCRTLGCCSGSEWWEDQQPTATSLHKTVGLSTIQLWTGRTHTWLHHSHTLHIQQDDLRTYLYSKIPTNQRKPAKQNSSVKGKMKLQVLVNLSNLQFLSHPLLVTTAHKMCLILLPVDGAS